MLLAIALAALMVTGCAGARDVDIKAVRVDQVGYAAQAPKIAIVRISGKPLTRFAIHRTSDRAKVLEGNLSAPVVDGNSGERLQLADFSSVRAVGTYDIRVEGPEPGEPFEIGGTPHRGLLRLAMRSYYGQRCGTSVDLGPEQAGYAHAACHRHAAYHTSSGRSGNAATPGGWHDAGDYGRYIVNSGITVGTLLWAYELYPGALRDLNLAIPESSNETPDVLDEVRWNLQWILSMQDSDGGVWQKQTSEKFPGFVRPEEDDSTSYVIGTGHEPYKSSCATADFAAVMAIAGRVYRPYDETFAGRALAASQRAWVWLDRYPNVAFRNPQGVGTGEYGDVDCSDERLWAAAELWRTSGDAAAHAYFAAHAAQAIESVKADAPPDWAHVGALAAWSYALDGRGDAKTIAAIRNRSKAAADAIVERSAASGYRIPMLRPDFVWGSNGVAANYGLQVLVADALQHDQRYVDAAADVVHYLLGRNPLDISWVTGSGRRPVMHPHHRPSGSDGIDAPWPGLLAGGPNGKRQDPVQWRLPKNTPPAKMYIDSEMSYATNEVCINWNAALVFVLAGIEAR